MMPMVSFSLLADGFPFENRDGPTFPEARQTRNRNLDPQFPSLIHWRHPAHRSLGLRLLRETSPQDGSNPARRITPRNLEPGKQSNRGLFRKRPRPRTRHPPSGVPPEIWRALAVPLAADRKEPPWSEPPCPAFPDAKPPAPSPLVFPVALLRPPGNSVHSPHQAPPPRATPPRDQADAADGRKRSLEWPCG